MNVLAFDLETTSTDPSEARIVQIGYVIADQSLNVLKMTEFFVDPEIDIPEDATEVHGITNEQVQDVLPFEAHAQRMQDLVDKHRLLAYNAAYDLQILDRQLREAGMPGIGPDHPVVDPLEIEKRLNPRTLEAVYERYTGEELDGAHTALADAEAALDVFKHQLKHDPEDVYLSDGQDMPPADLYGRLAWDEDGDLVFLFGKHQGEKVRDHRDYGHWMIRNGFPDQVKDLVREELGIVKA